MLAQGQMKQPPRFRGTREQQECSRVGSSLSTSTESWKMQRARSLVLLFQAEKKNQN